MNIYVYSTLIIMLTLFSQSVLSLKCYVCEFNAAFCKGINCYNNPDICSTSEFSTALIPVQECPRNCYTKAITNPAGFVIKWSRLCGPANDLTKGFKCHTEYRIGARIEECTCDKDFCNDSDDISINFLILMFCIVSSIIVL